jgi:hypothetical protein
MRSPRAAAAAALAFGAALGLVSCGTEHPPRAGVVPAAGGGGTSGSDGLNLAGVNDTPAGPCGSQTIPAVSKPPNISFVIDHSGSMGSELEGSGLSKYENARIALSRVLKAIGHRVRYGATIFPGLSGQTGCEAGDELMRVAPGDPASYAREDKTGPRLRDLLERLSQAGLAGGTPVAPTLDKMREILSELEGETYVVLITDGAPNCNAELRCGADACIPNIEELTAECTPTVNCCAPTELDPAANLLCVDRDASLAAVAALTQAGIDTYVIGMPGSEPYEQLLNDMAEVGGTARGPQTETQYYAVGDTEALEEALKAIAASVAITCEIPLDYEPPDPGFVNVYFDGQLVEYDAEVGWEWTEDGRVALRGPACEQLSSGNVIEVQVLAGCKTVVK